jgi:hypothetical protein
MQIKLVSQPDAVIARWQELVDDPELARWPGKVETDRFGRTIMSPPPAFGHVSYVAKIIRLWNRLLPEGQGRECHALALSTPVQWWQSKLDNPAIGWMSGSIIALTPEVQNDRSNNGTNQR